MLNSVRTQGLASGSVTDVWGAIGDALREPRAIDVSQMCSPSQLNPWTMDAPTLQFLAAIVPCLRPNRIVEFGTGLSTRILANACVQEAIECSILSFDHDPHYGCFDIAKTLPSGPVSLSSVLAPLVVRELGGQLVPAYHYSPPSIADNIPADLIVIDGPPEILGGRSGTLYQAMDMARPGTLVLLDDALRESEQRSIADWQRFLGRAIETRMLSGFPKGLAAILIRDPIPTTHLNDHHRRLLWERIHGSVPEKARVAIFDDDSLGCLAENCNDNHGGMALVRHNGHSPFDDTSATESLTDVSQQGVEHIVFTWRVFWWLDHFPMFASRLREHFTPLSEDSCIRVFRKNSH